MRNFTITHETFFPKCRQLNSWAEGILKQCICWVFCWQVDEAINPPQRDLCIVVLVTLVINRSSSVNRHPSDYHVPLPLLKVIYTADNCALYIAHCLQYLQINTLHHFFCWFSKSYIFMYCQTIVIRVLQYLFKEEINIYFEWNTEKRNSGKCKKIVYMAVVKILKMAQNQIF